MFALIARGGTAESKKNSEAVSLKPLVTSKRATRL